MHKETDRIRILIIIIALLSSAVLYGCKNRGDKETASAYYIYYINSSEDQLVRESIEPVSSTPEGLLVEFLSALGREPKNVMYKKAKMDIFQILDFQLNSNKQLTLQLDAAYSQVTGIKEILCRAAIVKTLCQIEGVDYVEFLVDGQPLMLTEEKQIGFMNEDDFIDNTSGETTYKQNTNVSMYFSDNTGKKLIEVPIKITFDGSIPLEQLVIQQLIQGPYAISGIEEDKVKATVPEGTKLNNVTVKDKVCYIDFNNKFLERITDVTRQVTLYSVVNVVVELPTINKVQFTIDGKTVESFGDIDFNIQFERNLDIVKTTY